MRFPERLAHPEPLPLVLSAAPAPAPKAETLSTETETKQRRMLTTCADLAAELKGYVVEQYRIEGKRKLARLRPPHPPTREERSTVLPYKVGAVRKTYFPKTRSSLAPDNRRGRSLRLRASGLQRLGGAVALGGGVGTQSGRDV